MRNLKKFLALVMAMVMALSLMVSANAAWVPVDGTTGTRYDDVKDVTPAFEEAVDVLTGMKVYQGDAEAPTFRAGSPITRAEVAALIYRLATGDTGTEKMDLYTTMHPFTDVRADAWYAGYVGYCYNAGYIKGTTATTFNPSANVTGYEVLAMILRAVGYDKNDEFTGPTWQVNVSSLATQLGILRDVQSAHYDSQLYLASRRDVVASLLFRTAAYVPQVIYTTAFGYQQTGMGTGSQVGTPATTGTVLNPTLGKQNFGLTMSDDGVVVGNQQTGETATRMGYADSVAVPNVTTGTAVITGTVVGSDPAETVEISVVTNEQGVATAGWNEYAYTSTISLGGQTVTYGTNVSYELDSGIDLLGHNLKLWFDDRPGYNNHVYAYYDQATTAVVEADNTDLTAAHTGGANDVDLNEAIAAAGFRVAGEQAVFNNSFGKFGSTDSFATASNVGDGVATSAAAPIASPVKLYKIIANNTTKTVDAVISLNVESSRITEANVVNLVPTLGMPVTDSGTYNTNPQLDMDFIDDTGNTKSVGGVLTGVIAQAALKGNSVKTLGAYEMGVHITGTRVRTPNAAEIQAINGTATERSYFLLDEVTATVEGTVVAYNNEEGTVTLQDGTVLERSDFYKTVVGWQEGKAANTAAPASVIPQAWMQGYDDQGNNVWVEGYANIGYKFYTDFEGKYLGAERSYGSTFLYGTYLDYSSEVSSSTFNYYMTGVTLNGTVETKQVTRFWWPDNSGVPTLWSLNGTNQLGIPYRDANDTTGDGYAVNGMGSGVYTGFAFTGTTVDSLTGDPSTAIDARGEYLNNMRRLGIYQAAETNPKGGIDLDDNVVINSTSTTLGAEQVGTTNRYFTEATKFILVSGFGTDTVKPEVYNGISELKGTSSSVILNLDKIANDGSGDVTIRGIRANIPVDVMTYYTESAYTYDQSGDTAMKIDTIILPKAAVSWTGGSNLFYVGDPGFSMINSWGTDAWKYTLYVDGEKREVWLTNDPYGASALTNDVFLHLEATGLTANDGQPIYRAGNYNAAGTFTFGTYLTNTLVNAATPGALLPASNGVNYLTEVTYSAITRDAQTATFTGTDGSKLLRVAGAKVVNLNKANSPAPGYIWKNVGDNLGDVNAAGSIDPVTANKLKVSAIVDPSNPLVVTTIYVCWDQNNV